MPLKNRNIFDKILILLFNVSKNTYRQEDDLKARGEAASWGKQSEKKV